MQRVKVTASVTCHLACQISHVSKFPLCRVQLAYLFGPSAHVHANMADCAMSSISSNLATDSDDNEMASVAIAYWMFAMQCDPCVCVCSCKEAGQASAEPMGLKVTADAARYTNGYDL